MAGTNVLVSAVVAPAGVCGALTAAAAAGEWKLAVSPLLLEELTGVLGRPKFAKLPTGAVERFVAALGAGAEVLPDAPRPWCGVLLRPRRPCCRSSREPSGSR